MVSTPPDEDTEQTTAPSSIERCTAVRVSSPELPERGSMRLHSHGANYVSSVHWAAVLDSISELKDHYEKEEEGRMLRASTAATDHVPHYSSLGPRLLYQPVHATKTDILRAVPARPMVDRLVARYFNAQGMAPGTWLYHSFTYCELLQHY
jgi:hypothetical protein